MSLLEIQPEPNVSIADLQAIQASGQSVMRSAHVGNARGYNLALAEAGVDMLLVDHTIVAQSAEESSGDRNYLPGSRVTREGVEPLKLHALGGLTMKTQIVCPDTAQTDRQLDEFHTTYLREAFPATIIQTNTEYLRTHESVAQTILGVALKTQPELFTRLVEQDGTIRTVGAGQSFANAVETYGILQLKDRPSEERGVLIPNDVDIAINFVVEALRTDSDTQYHVSGPDMQHYAKDSAFQERLNRLYRDTREQTHLGAMLPEKLIVKLVPGDAARFVTSIDRAPVVQRIFSLLSAKDLVSEERNNFMRSSSQQEPGRIQSFLRGVKQQIQELDGELIAAVNEADEFFVGPRQAPFVSQYDTLELGGIYTPAENSTLTMAELKQLAKQLRKLRGKSP